MHFSKADSPISVILFANSILARLVKYLNALASMLSPPLITIAFKSSLGIEFIAVTGKIAFSILHLENVYEPMSVILLGSTMLLIDVYL